MRPIHPYRSRILREDLHRAEIRGPLVERQTDSPAKAFLNSAFGLWLLSAIFLSGAGAAYQALQKRLDENKATFQKQLEQITANAEVISKLDVEISYRLSMALLTLSSVESEYRTRPSTRSSSERELQEARSTFTILNGLNSRAINVQHGLYPEFESYTLAALLADLGRRLPASERQDVEASLASFTAMITRIKFNADSPASTQAATALFQRVILKRWQGTAFHHMDCNATNPFC